MISKGFFNTFRDYLSKFKENERSKEFKEFLIALAEWRITQIVLVMVKEGITDFGPLTPRYLYNYSLCTNKNQKEIFERERYSPEEWEYKYYEAYEKLDYKYHEIVRTFPKEKRNIFYMHNIPPTSLFEYTYRHFFPWEPERITKKYEGHEIIRW